MAETEREDDDPALDDRAGVIVLLQLLERLKESGVQPPMPSWTLM